LDTLFLGGIVIRKSKNNVIHNNEIGKFQIGFEFENSDNNRIYNNTIGFAETPTIAAIIGGKGIFIRNGQDNIIHNNTISKYSGGLDLQNSGGNRIYENTFTGCRGVALYMNGAYSYPGGNRVFRNTFYGNGWALMSTKTQNRNRIEDNEIYQNEKGIIVSSDSNIVINNKTYDNHDIIASGIEVNGRWNVIANNQTFRNNYGIKVEYRSSNRILNNVVYENECGIFIGSKQNLVQANEIRDNRENSGLVIVNSYNHILDNQITNNQRCGIEIRGGRENLIENNLIDRTNSTGHGEWSSRGGVFMINTFENKLIKNKIQNTIASFGVYMNISSGNYFFKNQIVNNAFDGILLYENCHSNDIIQNQILSNGSMIGIEAGINIINSNYNIMRGNKVWYNCAGIIERTSHDNAFINNSVHFNFCIGTGIHIYGSNSLFAGNSVQGDAGPAFHCELGAAPVIRQNYITGNAGGGVLSESGSNPTITKNNFSDNPAFGVSNADPNVTMTANDNWWGDPAGPGANQTVQGNVTVQQWAAKPFDLVVSAGADTIYLPAGSRDSLVVSVQNWSNFDDLVEVSVSDSLGWLTGLQPFTLQLADSVGADSTLQLNTASSPAGTVNKLVAIAHSRLAQDQRDSSVVWIHLYETIIDTIIVQPDSVQLAPGDSLQFFATAYDRFNYPIPMRFSWSATGGTIDSSGLYHAGSEEGWFEVVATDSSGEKQGKAAVQIKTITSVQTPPPEAVSLPDQYALYQNYPNPFNPETTIKFQLPRDEKISLRIFDILGNQVRVLVDEHKKAGYYAVVWDSKDDAGNEVASGIYFYRLKTKEYVNTLKLVLIR